MCRLYVLNVEIDITGQPSRLTIYNKLSFICKNISEDKKPENYILNMYEILIRVHLLFAFCTISLSFNNGISQTKGNNRQCIKFSCKHLVTKLLLATGKYAFRTKAVYFM